MYSHVIVLALAAIMGCAQVVAVAEAATAAPKHLFSLRTESKDARFDDLCVIAYHAGSADAYPILDKCTPHTKAFYVNGSSIQSTYLGYPSTFQTGDSDTYQDFYQSVIELGFSRSYPPFRYSNSTGFLAGRVGFVACYWNIQGRPELFTLSQDQSQNFPGDKLCNCAAVKLLKG